MRNDNTSLMFATIATILLTISLAQRESARIRSFSNPYFSEFGLNTKRYAVSLRIQFDCRKIGTRKTPNTDTLHAVQYKIDPAQKTDIDA